MIYLFIFLLIVAGIYLYDYKKLKATEMFAFCLLCLLFIATAGLRYRLGNDSVIYERDYATLPAFYELSSFRFSSVRFEPGFVIFSSIPRGLSSDFTLFQFFHATVVNIVIFWFINKNTQNKFIALLFYFICLYVNLNMEVLREALAVCCFLLAWPFFKKGQWIYYYLLALLAVTFHVSGIMILLFPIMAIPGVRYMFRLGPQTFFVCIALFIIGFIIQRKFFFFIEMMSSNDSMANKANLYAKNSLGGMRLNIFGVTEQLLKFVLIPALGLWYMKKKIKNSQSSESQQQWIKKIELIMVAGMYLAVLSLTITIFNRFNNYVGMFNYVTMASCFFTTLKIRNKRFYLRGGYWAFILLFVCAVYGKLYFANTHGSSTHKVYMVYYPYESRLDPKENYDREVIFRLFKHLK